jgi:tetratricopeptide (TPR) repeat protein
MPQSPSASVEPNEPLGWRDALIILILLSGTLALYGRVARFDFIHFDDDTYVFNNARVRAGLTSEGAAWAMTTGYISNWHPLTWLSLMLDVQLFGVNPGASHLVNAGLHAVNAALLYVLLFRCLGWRWSSVWVAGIFAWHPLHVESVAWISERKDVLSTLFMLLCLLTYVRYVRTAGTGWYCWTVALLVLGLMSKPMLVTLPLVMLLLDVWPLRRITFGRGDNVEETPPTLPRTGIMRLRDALAIRSSLGWSLVEKVPMFALVLASVIVTYTAQATGRSVANLPIQLRLANATVSYAVYLKQMFFPTGLAVFYPLAATLPAGRIPTIEIAISALILLGITTTTICLFTRRPWLLIGWLWYLGTLLPVIGIVQVGAQAHADRYTYIPMIGIALAIGYSVEFTVRRRRAWVPLALSVTIASVLGCCALSWRQIGFWRDGETIMRHAADVVPNNYAAHSMLGEVYESRGQVDRATQEYRQALRIKPDDAISLNNLAVQARLQKRDADAMDLYRRAIAADPNFAPALTNYGNLLVERGQLNAAIRAYRQAIQRDPDFPQAYHNLALSLAGEGKLDDAIALWRRAIAIEPGYADAHLGLGNALLMRGQTQEGLAHLQKVLQLDPNRVDALNSLAWTLATHPNRAYQDGPKAVGLAERAVELTSSNDPLPLDTLAASYARVGDFAKAVQTAEKAIAAARKLNKPDLARSMQARLLGYQNRKAFASG